MTSDPEIATSGATGADFIRHIIRDDVANGRNEGRVVTRFPPEPNGYLHIGHAKSIVLNFDLAREFDGRCHLRFDDTNPLKEDPEYVQAIERDIRWLGYDWGEHLYNASDYFEQLYALAQHLVRERKAYVCSLDEAQIREYRGTVKTPGRPSPDRDRDPDESLDLLDRMRAGEFAEGAYTLRAKIDMASPNMKMRDPLIYRIRRVPHHRTEGTWNIYPMYDFAHPLSDALEMVTHSLCTLEFENNRAVYDWFVDNLPLPSRPRQIEFAKLNLAYALMGKRKLIQLVKSGVVDGWDDPRLATIAGLRRRGFTPASIREFCRRVGVARADNRVEYAQLEHAIREELNRTAPRYMAVLDPLKVTLTNYPEGQTELVEAVNNPEDPEAGTRQVPFGKHLFIEREDFLKEAPKKWFRLAPGREVRLKHAYLVTCEEVVEDADGNVVELKCVYDPDTHGGEAPDGRKVKGTLHWVSAEHAVDAEVHLYDQLFTVESPGDVEDITTVLSPDSDVVQAGAKLEPALAEIPPQRGVQFMRLGYFCLDGPRSRAGSPVFNRIVGLKDTWAKVARKG
jgi:glutaminyl-tRNA synthetase